MVGGPIHGGWSNTWWVVPYLVGGPFSYYLGALQRKKVDLIRSRPHIVQPSVGLICINYGT